MGKDLEETLNDTAFWHFRYTQQAVWTRDTRRYLFNQAGVRPEDRILEIGSGSGALLEALAADGFTRLSGIDMDHSALSAMRRSYSSACANGLAQPFPENCFDHTVCHFTLMWVHDPQRMVCEMARVTRPGGWVFALAEPDYGGRISYPIHLERLAEKQNLALKRQGAKTDMGRELLALLSACGLAHVSGGIIGAETRDGAYNPLSGDLRVLRRDLKPILDNSQIESLLAEAEKAAAEPGAIWYVPVCFACGQVR